MSRVDEIKARLAAVEDAKLRLRGVCKADSYAYLCAQDTLCAALEERLSHAPADIAWLVAVCERAQKLQDAVTAFNVRYGDWILWRGEPTALSAALSFGDEYMAMMAAAGFEETEEAKE